MLQAPGRTFSNAILRKIMLWLLALGIAWGAAVPAAAAPANAQTAWRLLDYLAVDYAGAVSGGKVISAPEYAEMREFSASVAEQLQGLPANPAKASLIQESATLRSSIEAKAEPSQVAKIARTLGTDLLRAYPVPLGPKAIPDAARGAKLYAQNCAACHGAEGDANTPMAHQLDPPPVDFTDRDRASQRTPFALYQVIDQGLEGTAMASFSSLPAADKWALAYHVGKFAYPAALAAKGKAIWNGNPALRAKIPDLDALSNISEKELAADLGPEQAAAVVAFLRSDPAAVKAKTSPLAIGRERLRQSVAAYEAGNRDEAKSLALSAYLDGFEPIEPTLSARDPSLLADVEKGMGQLRAAIADGKPAADIRARADAIDALFVQAESSLAPDAESAASAFVGAFTILLREGLEALLIVVAMLAFVAKADRKDMARPVHYGWGTALVAGLLTWWAATSLISISGASRELTEGFGSILAAVVLLFVGIWMHGKAQAGEWQRYIREKLGHALTKKSGWFLFALAFVAVYREIFETILFFAAMAAEGNVQALVAGALTGAAVLAVIAVAMLRFSKQLPIAKFFAYSSILIAILAVVLAGKGVAALQEAGLLGVIPLEQLPRIPVLGLFPTLEGIVAQVLSLAILLIGFAINSNRSRRLSVA
jgi:high-affinity iron transporter